MSFATYDTHGAQRSYLSPTQLVNDTGSRERSELDSQKNLGWWKQQWASAAVATAVVALSNSPSSGSVQMSRQDRIVDGATNAGTSSLRAGTSGGALSAAGVADTGERVAAIDGWAYSDSLVSVGTVIVAAPFRVGDDVGSYSSRPRANERAMEALSTLLLEGGVEGNDIEPKIELYLLNWREAGILAFERSAMTGSIDSEALSAALRATAQIDLASAVRADLLAAIERILFDSPHAGMRYAAAEALHDHGRSKAFFLEATHKESSKTVVALLLALAR